MSLGGSGTSGHGQGCTLPSRCGQIFYPPHCLLLQKVQTNLITVNQGLSVPTISDVLHYSTCIHRKMKYHSQGFTTSQNFGAKSRKQPIIRLSWSPISPRVSLRLFEDPTTRLNFEVFVLNLILSDVPTLHTFVE